MRTKHFKLEDWKKFNRIFYKKFPYTPEIIKAKLTSRYYNNLQANSLESKKPAS